MKVEKRMKPMLGTFVEIGLAVDSRLHPAFDMAFGKIAQIQSMMSFYDPKSELSQLNKNPNQWVEVSAETAEVIQHAKSLSQQSNGLFNPTLGGELIERRVLPNHFIHRFESRGVAQDIAIDNNKVFLTQPILLSLDGIAKGYAVDKAIETLKIEGIESGWVNAGGDIQVFGHLTLPVALRLPEKTHAEPQRPLCELHNQAIASSQAGQEIDQYYPGHIIAPKDRNISPALVSVIAHEAWLADGLTKVFALADEAERNHFAQVFNVAYHLHPCNPTKQHN
ncbi:FAD:protein FMN transferase [Hydrogenovibrio kuenenii]|uniref:FAD:protein FMN transferase n=1 Tax=Hydrogenovibrio kuenenii TaxID=63658 RepID=UPI0004630ED9|nr:FAD:protein FMN transferase [Hydrogenovibrio kuenenii]